MIKGINMKGAASFNQEGALLKNLKKVNYIYGSNGTGKTTISEFLRNQEAYPNCEVDIQGDNYSILVYNNKFVDENFRQDKQIKGIFTLGKDSKKLMDDIEETKSDIEKHGDKIDKLQIAINEKETEQEIIKKELQEDCWKIKNNFGIDFQEAFKGFGKSKDKLMNKFIQLADKELDLKTLDDIKQRKDSIFGRPQIRVEPIKNISKNQGLENSDILRLKIIGREDVDISGLISELNLSDWVQQGHIHMEGTEGLCPFCQQELPPDLDEKLNKYFNRTYSEQIDKLDDFAEKYEKCSRIIIEELKGLHNRDSNQYLNIEKVKDITQIIETKTNENKILIGQKKKEPSSSFSLTDITAQITEINKEIEKVNKETTKYNKLIGNIEDEKIKLIEDMWRYLYEQNKHNITQFKRKNEIYGKELNGIKSTRNTKKDKKRDLVKKLLEFQEQITSIKHSVNEINKIIRSFGFTNFKLATTEEKGSYKIIRENGEDAKDTLSEGEKTFITFLYFYHLLKGSTSKNDMTTKKIVVLDDPISSLDSNILFIVSSLIRKLIVQIHNDTSDLKQLLLLTHNIYFHKEVSFKKNKQTLNNETFWMIRKSDNVTSINKYEQNPIKSSYELLWNELKLIKDQSLITTQNVMRRILENYFTFFGDIDLTQVIDKFDDEEKPACHSLLSWINDGSHHINEDLFVESGTELTEKYFSVFREIFYKMGHQSHFKMMIKDYEFEISSGVNSEIDEDLKKSVGNELEAAKEQVASSKK